jgi:hypothetical protein
LRKCHVINGRIMNNNIVPSFEAELYTWEKIIVITRGYSHLKEEALDCTM